MNVKKFEYIYSTMTTKDTEVLGKKDSYTK